MYHEQHLKRSQIARELNLNVKTVVHWLGKDKFEARKNRSRSSKLDPWKRKIREWLEKHDYSAMQVYQMLSDAGYTGSYSILRDYVKKIRPAKAAAYLKLSFEPGECAQVDWGCFGNISVGKHRRKLSFFVMVLCYSRKMYVEFTVSEKQEHFLECHQRAFEYFGGVPEKVMVDNCKTAVLSHPLGGDVLFNPQYLDFSKHFGFKPIACNVRSPHEKGRVENAVGYVKKNFLRGLDAGEFKLLNPKAHHWLENTANNRVHGQTRKKPQELFELEEKSKLQALPIHRYATVRILEYRISPSFRFTLDTNQYSVPSEYAGERVKLHIFTDKIIVCHKEQIIAEHCRSYDKRQDYEHPNHPKALLLKRRKGEKHKLLQRFLQLSECAQDYYLKLGERTANPDLHVRKILALSEHYPLQEVKTALEDAFCFDCFKSEYVANILEQKNNVQQETGVLHVSRNQDALKLEIPESKLDIYDQ
jgi:transposase